jgi:NTE family protein
MLSGGGALGPFHVGVVKALHEQGLLPEVISGASAGSIVAAVVGTQSDETLTQLFDAKSLARAFQDFGDEGVETLKPNQRMSVDSVRSVIESLIPDMTFAEAFEATGRKINVSVSPREVHQKSRLLNAVTSPNVMIREAVLASCAIPGIYPPVTLAARNAAGERVPYVPSRQWVDGSVTDDLPAKRLSRLYGANHFITSQTNPVVLWRITDPDSDDLLVRGWNIYQNAMKQWFRATYPFAVAATKNLYPLNLITRMTYSVAVQDYTADINILPRRRFWDPRKLLSALDEHDTRYLIREGELATWPRIEMIRNCTEVSRALDAVLDPLETRYANQRAVLHAV